MSTKLLPPDLAVRLAWSLTGEWSETPEIRDAATLAKDRLKALKETAQTSPDPKEKDYVPKAIDYIRACQRSLATINAARNLNFGEVKEMRDAQRENIEAYSKLTANWQSAWPRLASVGIGGSAGAITLVDLVKPYYPAVNPALMFVLGAGILYVANEFFVLPLVRRRLMLERVRGDYDRDLYYGQFVQRTRAALISLYLDVDRAHAHPDSFGSPYDPQADPAKIVEGALGGVFPVLCPKVHAHMNDGLITPNLWSMCETGVGVEKCRHWAK